MPSFADLGLDPDVIETIAELAESDPLAHPLAFELGEMEYELPPPPHLVEIMCSVYAGITNPAVSPRYLARILPREHGKSATGSKTIPAWLACRDRNIRVLILSESEDQAIRKLDGVREVLRAVGPRYGLQIETNNATALTVNREADHSEPTIHAQGMNSGLTGGHYDVLIFDDIVSWDNQRTEQRRETAYKKYQDYLNLESGGESVFLVLGTRKHPEDLYSKIIGNPAWDSVVEQAISDWSIIEDRRFDVVTNDGNRYRGGEIHEIPGDETIVQIEPDYDVDVLWPERHSLEKLIDKYLKASADGESLVWQRENQNDAHALMGQVLSEDMLHFVDSLPEHVDRYDLVWFAGLDLGIVDDPEKAANDDTDYWALAIAGFDPVGERFYLDKIARRRGLSPAEAAGWVEANLLGYPFVQLYAEENHAQSFWGETASEHGLDVKGITNTDQKEDRIITMSSRFENGVVKILADEPDHDTWAESSGIWSKFCAEWAAFPTGSHDDMLDAVCMALQAKKEQDEERRKTASAPFV